MLVTSIMLTGYYVATKNWIASNVLAFSLALASIQVLHLDSFKSGMILLGGFVLFDLYWTYGSSLLASLSDNFDLPFQVAFPSIRDAWSWRHCDPWSVCGALSAF